MFYFYLLYKSKTTNFLCCLFLIGIFNFHEKLGVCFSKLNKIFHLFWLTSLTIRPSQLGCFGATWRFGCLSGCDGSRQVLANNGSEVTRAGLCCLAYRLRTGCITFVDVHVSRYIRDGNLGVWRFP